EDGSALIRILQFVELLSESQIASLANILARVPYVCVSRVGGTVMTFKRPLNLSLAAGHQYWANTLDRSQTHTSGGAGGVNTISQLLEQGFVRAVTSDPSELG